MLTVLSVATHKKAAEPNAGDHFKIIDSLDLWSF